MPFEAHYDPAEQFLYLHASGTVTDEQLISTFRGLYEDPGLPEGVRVLLDARTVTRVEVTSAGIAQLVALAAERAPSSSQAVVVTDDPVVRGMTRMYELRRGGSEGRRRIAMFEDLTKGLVWLDVPVHILVELAER